MPHQALRCRLIDALYDSPSTHVFDPRRPTNQARSDFDLDPDPAFMNGIPVNMPVRQAAVLVPIVLRDDPTILLTQRASNMPSHAGQIAFPGGKIEPDDRDARAAALRETSEEVGLERDFIETIGYLDNYRTGTNFNVVPVVALVTPGFNLKIDTREVALAFEVPLQFLMQDSNHQLHKREVKGRERTYYAMPYQDHYIWGATAGMIRNLYERLNRA